MKPLLTNLFLLFLVIVTSCHQALPVEQTDQEPIQYTNDLSQAQTWFDGHWKLTALTAMIPNLSIPDVELVVDTNQITVVQQGKPTDRVNFALLKTAYGFQLNTDAHAREDNWYVRNPGLQVSSNRLVLTTGGSESSTFRFKRVE